MTWLTWRQLRFPLLSVYAALALVVVVLVLTRPERGGVGGEEFLYRSGMLAVYALPAVLGVFWGVPMITRELEAGTHNLVWNQSTTRTRWLAVKLGLGVPAAAVAAGLLGLVVTWWADPVDAVAGEGGYDSRITPGVFAARGIAPFGYAAFAFVLGVVIAILVRRTVVAMAALSWRLSLLSLVVLPPAIWLAGEAAAIQRLRRHLFDVRGLSRAAVCLFERIDQGRAFIPGRGIGS